jgi:hypothetical protein
VRIEKRATIKKNLVSLNFVLCCFLLLLAQRLPAETPEGSGAATSLKEALEKQQWQAEQTTDGSTIYRQSQASPSEGIDSPATTSAQQQQLQQALQSLGWKTEWDNKGNLLLYPVDTGSDSSTKESAATAMRPATDSPLPNLPGLEYWHVERDRDGVLFLYPVNRKETALNQRLQGAQCAGLVMADEHLELPVDKWHEARQLATNWLKHFDQSSLSVGRIRKVLHIYLISLVEQEPPYRLQHQLAVRATDGHVMLLY